MRGWGGGAPRLESERSFIFHELEIGCSLQATVLLIRFGGIFYFIYFFVTFFFLPFLVDLFQKHLGLSDIFMKKCYW